MKVIVDTNILIDHFAQRQPYCQTARKLLVLGALGEFELWASSSQITDVFYLMTSGPKKMSPDAAKEALRKLSDVVHICSLGEREVFAALDSTWNDVENACIHQAAVKVGAQAIATRNKKDFALSSIRALDCEDLFARIEAERGIAYAEIGL